MVDKNNQSYRFFLYDNSRSITSFFGIIFFGLLAFLGILGAIFMIIAAFILYNESNIKLLILISSIISAFMGYFIGWSTFKNFIKRWKNKSLIYLAISDNILIYQDFDIMGKLKKIEIPLKDIQNIQFITVPGSAENPDAYYVRLYYKDNNQQKYLDIDYFFGSSFLPKGINLLNILQQEIKQ